MSIEKDIKIYGLHFAEIWIGNRIKFQIDRCPDPAGLLRVEVVQALDLMAKDRQAFSKDTSDPYAVFGIGENDEAFKVCISIKYKYIIKL